MYGYIYSVWIHLQFVDTFPGCGCDPVLQEAGSSSRAAVEQWLKQLESSTSSPVEEDGLFVFQPLVTGLFIVLYRWHLYDSPYPAL